MPIADDDKKALLEASAGLTRRKFLGAAASAGASAIVAAPALADSLADVPQRAPGNPVGPVSNRSQFVHLDRITEASPGKLKVDAGLIRRRVL